MFQTQVVEEIKTHFVFSNFLVESLAIYEIIWKNVAKRGGSETKNVVHAR